MGRKVFVSYKYGDTQVQDLNIYEENWFGQNVKVQTKVRHYVNELSEILDREDHIYKGEDDGQSLADFSDEYIASALRSKIFDSSITIVLVSKGMKTYQSEKDQWIPWEISYSLKEYTRDGRTSLSNGIIAVVLPDQWGSYEYYITQDSVCDCRNLNTSFLFQILKDNMFNIKKPNTEICTNGSTVYYGDSCYIQSVKWEDFKSIPYYYLNKAIELRDKKEGYNITKTVK
ncbi:TIR domain-containing protein [Myroides odoratimimus]|uniref:TIR domain-containing protein n=1 Tax=Myroides odoratimimus TaxID=76832 RepID=UPI001CE04D6D|nr:TIR domain-containing protein [Myroides odoratimimus]MCA4793918.1 TIR domain-containing protein [Myroides odoratimimus]MCA4821182.1 TIR domain-containing protein [Myroides odoratimimus]MDM1504211.1 TIR domain-containing protein [Myroides odoratimimus]